MRQGCEIMRGLCMQLQPVQMYCTILYCTVLQAQVCNWGGPHTTSAPQASTPAPLTCSGVSMFGHMISQSCLQAAARVPPPLHQHSTVSSSGQCRARACSRAACGGLSCDAHIRRHVARTEVQKVVLRSACIACMHACMRGWVEPETHTPRDGAPTAWVNAQCQHPS